MQLSQINLALTRIGGIRDPDAVIKALFANSEQGAWYDPSDFSTMFQDSAGTTPVTAVGQPVGLIRDKSGRGNHAFQATAAARPQLQQDGNGKYYLVFDGVDDSLDTAAINFTATNKISVFVGVKKESDSAIKQLLCTGINPTDSGAFGIYAPLSSNDYATQFSSVGQGSLQGATAASFPMTASHVISSLIDCSIISPDDSIIKTRVNGVSQTLSFGGSGQAAPSTFGNLSLSVGSRPGAVIPFPGRIYSLIILGRLATTQEITDTETWVNSKTGAY